MLVKLFRVDVLYPITGSEKVRTFIKQFPYLRWPFFESGLFTQGFNKVYTQILDIYHPIRVLYQNEVRNNPASTFRATIYEWSNDDPLHMTFLTTFGGFPPKEETGTDYGGLIEKYLRPEMLDLSSIEAVPSESFSRPTPNWIGAFKLRGSPDSFSHWKSPGFYYGDATNFDDLVNYWNLRAAGADIVFYDPLYKDRLDNVRTNYLKMFQREPAAVPFLDSGIYIWHASNDSDIDLTEFGKGVSRCSADPGIWNGRNITATDYRFEYKSVLANVDSTPGRISVSFPLPEKPVSINGIRSFQHLIASIDCGIGLYNNELETLAIPFLPQLNESIGRQFYFLPHSVRVEPGSVGIVLGANQDDLTISALSVSSVISNIFKVADIQAKPSQSGLVISRLIQQLGGLKGCRVFKIAGVRELIDTYKPEQHFTTSAAETIIGKVKDGKLNFSDYEDLYIEPRAGNTKLTPRDAFNYMLRHGLFRVGLELKCPTCLLPFWLALDNVRTLSKCEYCGSEFCITSQLKDRDWRYRRSGLLGKENHLEGAIPVILTLQQIQTLFLHSNFLYTTSMELEGSSIKKCEADFVIIKDDANREPQVAIGECKTRLEISEDDVEKMLSVAESLEANGLDTFIVFSKLAEFNLEELKRCARVNGKYRNRLVLLTTRELEPYDIYEKTEKEFDIKRHAMSLEDMAEITKAVFFEKRTRPS
jgi:hypothetical protein